MLPLRAEERRVEGELRRRGARRLRRERRVPRLLAAGGRQMAIAEASIAKTPVPGR